MYAETSEKAEELGEAFLFYLQEKYKGLDGEVSVTPLYSGYLEIERPLYEIILPPRIYTKLQFFRKIINYYKTPRRKMDLDMFILWKKDNLDSTPDPYKYMIKIFI